MGITVHTAQTPKELKQYVTFPWRIYQGDPHWVPPLIEGQLAKLNPQLNPFWKTAERQLWVARKDGDLAGTITAIIDHRRNQLLGQKAGAFGFFECIQDQEVARALFNTAEAWLQNGGMTMVRGPYNPSESDDNGILIDGFETRPAMLEAHNPPYYPPLLEANGYRKYSDMVARLYRRSPTLRHVEEALPEKLLRVAERASQRPDLKVRTVRTDAWEDEINLARQLYNTALADVPDYIPMTADEFKSFAASFKSFIEPSMALVAEIKGQPVGFALALPDVYEVLQHVNGRLGPLGLAKAWWFGRKIKRASFKILAIVPDYQVRGIEAVLILAVSRSLWAKGYPEIDMSLIGETNLKSNQLLENLGFQVYRRFRIYEKEL